MLVGDAHLDLAIGAWLEAIAAREHGDIEHTLFRWHDNLPDRGVDLCV